MPCAGPYLPETIYLSHTTPSDPPNFQFFLHQGWNQTETFSHCHNRHPADRLLAYASIPFDCQKRRWEINLEGREQEREQEILRREYAVYRRRIEDMNMALGRI